MITGFKIPMDPDISAGYKDVQVETISSEIICIRFVKLEEIVGFNLSPEAAESVSAALIQCVENIRRLKSRLTIQTA